MNKFFFNQDYKNNKFNIEFLDKKNFTLFRVKNFLDESSYEFIKKSFPEVDNEMLAKFDLAKVGKYNITSTEEYYKNLLEKNEGLQLVHNSIFSKKFYNYFYENLKKEFVKSRLRSKDLKYFIKLLKPKTLEISQNYLKNIFQTYVRRQIEYSFVFNNGSVAPHTDSRAKMLTLILFFPEGREGEKDIGTTFWNSDIKNLKNQHITDPKEIKKFRENSNVLTKLEFNKYDLYGFIRNEVSWHSVEPFNLGKDYVRRSMIVNFYF